MKARQMTFCLDKYGPLFKFNKITFVCIDQIRANLKIEGPYVQQEKSVGFFKDIKAATNIYALQHNVQQWVFLGKKKAITMVDGLGVDGWKLEVYTEKNKLAPSQHAITCVFDKHTGIDKFWSEYEFLAEQLPGEKRLYKGKVMPFPLMMKKNGSFVSLSVKDPDDPSVVYKSDNFYRKDAKKKYTENEEFRQWFDYAVQLSVKHRIVQGIFRQKDAAQESILNVQDDSQLEVEFEEQITPDVEEHAVSQEVIEEAVDESITEPVPVMPTPVDGAVTDAVTMDEGVEPEGGYTSVFDG